MLVKVVRIRLYPFMKGHNGSVGTLYKRSICKCFSVYLNNNVTDYVFNTMNQFLVNLVLYSIPEVTSRPVQRFYIGIKSQRFKPGK